MAWPWEGKVLTRLYKSIFYKSISVGVGLVWDVLVFAAWMQDSVFFVFPFSSHASVLVYIMNP